MTTQGFVNERYARANEYDIQANKLTVREARTIPNTADDLSYSEVVKMNLTMVFADIRGYTKRIDGSDSKVAARTMTLYVTEMAAAIRHHGGTIVSIEGDGIIGAFADSSSENAQTIAVRCVITMNTLLDYVVNKKLKSFKQEPLTCGYGVDSSQLYITRAGIRGKGKNELVFIGSAMTRVAKYQSKAQSNKMVISSRVYNALEDHYRDSDHGWNWDSLTSEFGTLYQMTVNHWSGIEES